MYYLDLYNYQVQWAGERQGCWHHCWPRQQGIRPHHQAVQGAYSSILFTNAETSVIDINTLNLDLDPGILSNVDPDPELCYQF